MERWTLQTVLLPAALLCTCQIILGSESGGWASPQSAVRPAGVGRPDALALVDQLRSPNPAIRIEALRRIGLAIGENDRTLFAAVRKALTDPAPSVRVQAAGVLAHTGQRAVPALTEVLADSDGRVRAAAASALAQLGPLAKAAAPTLVEHIRDEDALAQEYCLRALAYIGAGEDHAAKLTGFVRDTGERAEMRRIAATALVGIGPAVVPMLVELVKGADVETRILVLQGACSPSHPYAVALCIAALEDANVQVQSEAMKGLWNLGPKAKPAIPVLKRALGSPHVSVRNSASALLNRLDNAD